MKKLLCFLVVLSMVLSIFSITSFATTVEKAVWTQDFENTTGFNNYTQGTYTSGARYHLTGAAHTTLTEVKTENTNNYFYAMSSKQSYDGRFKIYLDQTAFEDGATYKIRAKVKYMLGNGVSDADYNTYSANYPTLTAGVGVTDTTSIEHGGTIATATLVKTTVNLNEETIIESNTFVYDKASYTVSDEAQINAFFTTRVVADGKDIQALYIDDVKIVKVSDETIFNTTADAGYYKEGDGIIAFNAETLFGKDEVTAFGMYIYRNDLGESEKVELKSDDISVFEENDGKFYATVTNIPAEYFDKKVACIPYIVIDGNAVFGDILTYAVNDSGKYLGAKGE